jgi:hypothetical protein
VPHQLLNAGASFSVSICGSQLLADVGSEFLLAFRASGEAAIASMIYLVATVRLSSSSELSSLSAARNLENSKG